MKVRPHHTTPQEKRLVDGWYNLLTRLKFGDTALTQVEMDAPIRYSIVSHAFGIYKIQDRLYIVGSKVDKVLELIDEANKLDQRVLFAVGIDEEIPFVLTGIKENKTDEG